MKIVVVGYGKIFQSVIEGCLLSNNTVAGVLRVNRVRYPRFINYVRDILCPDDDKMFVKRNNLYDIDVPSVNSEKFRKILVGLNPDIVFVSSWCERFSMETIKVPKIATINIHPSLLPKYRGPNPYAQVIKHGETQTGLTFHIMDANYDTGAILHQRKIPVDENETGGSLRNKCSLYAKEETINLLNEFENGIITPIAQNNKIATYFHQLTLADCVLSFLTESSLQLDRRIRALNPWLKCVIPCGNEFFMFNDYEISEEKPDETAKIVYNDGETVKISTNDKKVMVFKGVYPFRLMPKFFHKKFVEHFLPVGNFAR